MELKSLDFVKQKETFSDSSLCLSAGRAEDAKTVLNIHHPQSTEGSEAALNKQYVDQLGQAPLQPLYTEAKNHSH